MTRFKSFPTGNTVDLAMIKSFSIHESKPHILWNFKKPYYDRLARALPDDYLVHSVTAYLGGGDAGYVWLDVFPTRDEAQDFISNLINQIEEADDNEP